jgi:hypothetical protein
MSNGIFCPSSCYKLSPRTAEYGCNLDISIYEFRLRLNLKVRKLKLRPYKFCFSQVRRPKLEITFTFRSVLRTTRSPSCNYTSAIKADVGGDTNGASKGGSVLSASWKGRVRMQRFPNFR